MAHVSVLSCGEGLFQLKRATVPLAGSASAAQPVRRAVFDTIETCEAIACIVFLRHALRSWKCSSDSKEELYKIPENALQEAIVRVRAYLEDYIAAKREAEALAETESGPRIEMPTSADLTIYRRLLDIREEQDRLAVQRGYCESRLKLRIGDGGALKGVASWRGQLRKKVDLQAFKFTEPDRYDEVWQRYRSDSYTRYFVLERPS